MPATEAPRGPEPLALILLLGGLTAFGPLSIDMYLPAFPAMAAELGAAPAAVQSTLMTFLAGMALGQVVYGSLADRHGRKGPLLAGLALYTLASVGCALSGSIHSLAAWRAVQGFGGSAGVVISRALVRDSFDGAAAARIFSHLMLVMGAAPILAPSLGAQVLVLSGWRAIFWLLAALGLLALVVVRRRLVSSYRGDPAAGGVWTMLRGFGQVLADRSFRVPALTACFAQGTLFAYIAGSSLVFVGHFRVSEETFGLLFGLNAAALIGAAQWNARLLRRRTPAWLLARAAAALALAGALVAAVAWSGLGGAPAMACVFFLLLGVLGFVGSNAAACALSGHGKRAGTAAALLGTLQLSAGVGAGLAGSLLLGVLHDAPLATGLVILAGGVAAAAVQLAARANIPRP